MGASISNLKQIEREIQTALSMIVKDVAQITWEEAKRATPIKTGNARKNWTKNVGNTTFNVENRVPYIEALENNHSKQTRGKGIIMPALTQIKGRTK
jgi:hypothetical protein